MSKAHKYWGIALLILTLSGSVSAQNKLAYSEFGLGLGTLNYSGDIATTKTASSLLTETRPNFSAFAKRNFNDWLSIGILAMYGSVYASDVNHRRQNRGLEVSTSMFQINPFFEINLIKFGKFHYDRKFTIFLRAGGGFLAYNPDPVASDIYPPEFDPQINAYNSLNLFGGMGMKFRVGYQTILSFDVSLHNSGVDNIDGILAIDPDDRGANDTYGGINVSISRAIF
jgi:hypothetical protein